MCKHPTGRLGPLKALEEKLLDAQLHLLEPGPGHNLHGAPPNIARQLVGLVFQEEVGQEDLEKSNSFLKLVALLVMCLVMWWLR
jgi:hypothetical protein